MPDFAAPCRTIIDELKHLPGIDKRRAKAGVSSVAKLRPKMRSRSRTRFGTRKKKSARVLPVTTLRIPILACIVWGHAEQEDHLRGREAHNIMAVEKTRTYSGMYHVLGGSLSPLSGRGPEQLHIKSLIERLKGGTVEEIIIATNPTAEGEATAVYLSKLLKPLGVRVTRIGVGIPVGADLNMQTK